MNIDEKKFSRQCVAMLVAGVLLVSGAFGATLVVPDDYSTIQGALDASSSGDTILVKSGRYYENLTLPVHDIVLKSEMGAMETIIDGLASGSVVKFESGSGSGSLLSGFVLTNGDATNYYGGGVHLDNAILTIENCVIIGNKAAPYGGGLRCTNSASLVLANSTIVGNEAQFGGGLYSGGYTSTIIVNSILWDNSAPEGHEIYVGLGSVDVSYSDVNGGQLEVVDDNGNLTWGTGNIDANPQFIHAVSRDIHIQHDSPCRDAGNNSAVHVPEFDFEGDPRVAGGAVDMGADEYHVHLYCRGDVIAGDPLDVYVVGSPDRTVTLLLSDWYQDPPLVTYFGDLYVGLPFLYEDIIGKTWAPGWMKISPTIPAHWQTGNTYYIQALVGSWWDISTELTNVVVLDVQ